MKEREYQGDQGITPDVASHVAGASQEAGRPMAVDDGVVVDGLSRYQYNRARRLEHVLTRIEQAEEIYATYHPQGYRARVTWSAASGEKQTQDIDAGLLTALKGIAVTLFSDLKAEGEDALACELIDQHRLPRPDDA